jgi:hypothetical protein
LKVVDTNSRHVDARLLPFLLALSRGFARPVFRPIHLSNSQARQNAISRRDGARGLKRITLPIEGAGKAGCHKRTRSLVCKSEKHTSSHHRFAGTPGLPCAMVLTVSFALSLVNRACCHHPRCDCEAIVTELTPASGRQDHATSPSASSGARLAPPTRPPHPAPNVRDDRDTPL